MGAFVGVDVDEDGATSADAGLRRGDGGVLDDLSAGVEDEGGCYVGDFHGRGRLVRKVSGRLARSIHRAIFTVSSDYTSTPMLGFPR